MRSLVRRAPTLTRRGWGLAVGAVLLAAAGRILGLFELFVLAAACAGLVAAAVVMVASRPVHLEAVRRLHPPRVHAGTDTRVELVVRNHGRRTSPVVAIRDSFQGGSEARTAPRIKERARFLVAPLRPGQEERASYRLFADRRGRYTLGPLEVDRGDAFGLVSSVRAIAPVTELTVYPKVDAIAPLPTSHGSIASGTYLRTAVGSSGEEFYGLREYQVGDDMRRVHWPSTARLDELIVRQLELPWEGRATVVLDTRASSHDDASIEVAVSAAASIVLACVRDGSSVRLVATDGFDSGTAKGAEHLDLMLAHLAVVHPEAPRAGATRPGSTAPGGAGAPPRRGGWAGGVPSRGGDTAPGGAGAPPRRGGRAGGVPARGGNTAPSRGGNTAPARGGDTAVITTSAASLDDLAVVAGPRRRQERLTVVVVDRPGREPRQPGGGIIAGATTVRVSASVPLTTAWVQAMVLPGAGGRR